eukprot:m.221645 g.221645  ORF g.221645 m.221645 type:complete len:335 (+) comp39962_c0_seq1:1579-2583(+)
MHWGSVDDIGCLCHFKHQLGRSQVDKEAKKFQAADEFLQDALDSTLVAALARFLDIDNPQESLPQHIHSGSSEVNAEELQKIASQFVKTIVSIPRDASKDDCDHAFNSTRSFMHSALLYRDLRHAIHYEDGSTIISLWRWWLVYFVATSRSNYSREAANLQANLQANFSHRMAYIVTNNRTVNVSGKVGRGKPIDMAIEHHNLILKNALRGAGANVTENHLRTISLASQEIHKAASLLDTELQVFRSTAHTFADAKKDVNDLVKYLLDQKICERIPGRLDSRNKKFEPYFNLGMQKCLGQQWIKKYLRSTATVLDADIVERERHNEIECLEDIL